MKILIKKIYLALNSNDKKKLILMCFTMIANSFAEIIGIGAIIPFIAVVSGEKNNIVFKILNSNLKINSIDQRDLILLTLAIYILISFFATSIKIINIIMISKFSFDFGKNINVLVFANIITKKFNEFYSKNTNDYLNIILNKSNSIIYNIIIPILNIISGIFIILFSLIIFMFMSWKITLLILFSFILFYLLFAVNFKSKINLNSISESILSNQLVRSVRECLAGIKEIILNQSYHENITKFSSLVNDYKRIQATNNILALMPKNLLEFIGITAICAYLAIYSANNGEINNALPYLAMVALASQKLIPLIQNIYSSFISIRVNKDSAIDVLEQISFTNLVNDNSFQEKIHFKSLKLENVSYRYSDNLDYIFKKINLVIERGDKVAIIGRSGSGKTSLINIILGLVEPTKGSIYLNGMQVNLVGNIGWYNSISHLPQDINLYHGTILDNIKKNILRDVKEIDVIAAAKKAHLHETIIDLNNSYNTLVGENGGKLSGGQRQRLSLAKAYLKSAEVIIMDEPTSALDKSTSISILSEIAKSNETFIIISHDLKSLNFCNKTVIL